MKRSYEPPKTNKTNRTTGKRTEDYEWLVSAAKSRFAYLIICILGGVLYWNSLSFPLGNLDEDLIILKNRQHYASFANIDKAFSRDAFLLEHSGEFYRPLQTVSFMIDTQVSGTSAFAFRLDNLLLHLLSCCSLLFLLRLFKPHSLLAFPLALLYTVHPLFTSAVVWIPARGDLLLALFGTLSIATLILFLRQRKVYWLLLHAVLFLLALLSKETALFLPILYACFFFIEMKPVRWNTTSFIGASYLAGYLIYFYLRYSFANLAPSSIQAMLKAGISNLAVFPECISKLFLPAWLSSMPVFTAFPTVIGLAFLAAGLYFLFKYHGRNKTAMAAVIWFILMTFPAMLYQNPLGSFAYQYLEHRTYFPLMSLPLIFIVVSNEQWLRTRLPVFFTVVAIALVVLSFLSFSRMKTYESPFTFYSEVIRTNPSNMAALYNRGTLLKESKQYTEALTDLDAALKLKPDYINALVNRGNCLQKVNRLNDALKDYNEALRVDSTFTEAWYNRANLKSMLNDNSGALADYTMAVRQMPNLGMAYNNRGIVRKKVGDLNGALADFITSAEKMPNNAFAYNNIGETRMTMKDYPEALVYLNKSIDANPSFYLPYQNRSLIRLLKADTAGALADIDLCLKNQPGYPEALYNRGIIELTRHQYPAAIADFTQLLRTTPRYAKAYLSRATARFALKDKAGALEDCKAALALGLNDARIYLERFSR